MAVYNCECGLIISTSSERPRCLRCLRVLGPQDVGDRAGQPLAGVTVTAVVIADRRGPHRQVAMGYPLHEQPVLSPVVVPK